MTQTHHTKAQPDRPERGPLPIDAALDRRILAAAYSDALPREQHPDPVSAAYRMIREMSNDLD